MHIPDGYLGPATSGTLLAAMLPLWWAASRFVRKTLDARQVPLLAIGAAFSFVLMMFNVPILGGSTGHAVGGVLVAILLGPWAATIAITVALVIQALLFGDGGVTAIGANCFNMAVALPFAGYHTYALLARGAAPGSRRRVVAAFAAGYVGVNVAALLAGVEFGLQPWLCHAPDGHALYCPYGLGIAVPVMAGEHLLFFGWVEAVVTGGVFGYLQRHTPELLGQPARLPPASGLWIALGVLIALTPLGLLLPAHLHAGGAWGEWSAEEIRRLVGYLPAGMERMGELWKAPLPDYAFHGWEAKGLGPLSLAYMASAVVGIAAIAGVCWLLGRALAGTGRRRAPRVDFVERSIRGTLAFFKEALFAEETAALPGALQSLDPRVKIATILLLLLAALFAGSLVTLGLLYLWCLLWAVRSQIRLGFFLKRTWVFIPLFSLLIAVPALFSFVSPGEPVLTAGAFSITRNGLRAAGFFLGRVTVSVSLVVLLSMTTRHFELLKALRSCGIPAVFVMVLGMGYRYIYLFVEIVEHTHLAIRSRVGRRLRTRKGRKIVAWNIAQLWARSHALNEQVYGAMVARGFRGEPVTAHRFRLRARDGWWLAASAALVLLLACLEYGSRT